MSFRYEVPCLPDDVEALFYSSTHFLEKTMDALMAQEWEYRNAGKPALDEEGEKNRKHCLYALEFIDQELYDREDQLADQLQAIANQHASLEKGAPAA